MPRTGAALFHTCTHVRVHVVSISKQDLQGQGEGGEEQARKLRDFFTALALCHTVIPERFEDTDEVRVGTVRCGGRGGATPEVGGTHWADCLPCIW